MRFSVGDTVKVKETKDAYCGWLGVILKINVGNPQYPICVKLISPTKYHRFDRLYSVDELMFVAGKLLAVSIKIV